LLSGQVYVFKVAAVALLIAPILIYVSLTGDRVTIFVAVAASVVALIEVDWTDVFPATSYAATVYEYVVEGVRAVSE
jgi:hypothetical protein